MTAPQVTIEAIVWAVRDRGLTALREPATFERLARCDDEDRQQVNVRIAKLVKTGTVS